MNPMKKARSLFSLILSLALVVTSLPMVFMTAVAETGEGTEQSAITYYVDTTNTNEAPDGSESNPFPTIAAAVTALNGADGTIILTNEYTGGTTYTADLATNVAKYENIPEHAGVVTYVGAIAVPNSSATNDAPNIKLAGPTVFKDITYVHSVATGTIYTQCYDFSIVGNATICNAVYVRVSVNSDSSKIPASSTTTFSGTGLNKVSFCLLKCEQVAIEVPNHQILVVDANINKLYLGTANGAGGNGSVPMATLILNSGSISEINAQNSYKGGGYTSWIGTYNVIANNGLTIPSRNRSYKDWTTTADNVSGAILRIGKEYDIVTTTVEGCGIYPTNAAGKFTVIGDKIAVATKGDEVVKSVDGVLDLSAASSSYSFNAAATDNSQKHVHTPWVITYEDAPAPAPEFDYTAAISSAATTVERGANVAVKVAVASEVKENWASAQLSVEYDADRLTFIPEDNAPYTYVDNNGVITIGIYGDTKALGDVVTLNFATKAEAADCDVATTVTLTEAGFSTQKDAEESDLSEAEITADEAVITITKKTVTITVNATDNGNPILDLDAESVTEGSDIVFGIVSGGENYNYTVSYKVGDGEAVALTPDQDGNYTVPGAAVTDNITITATRTPKTFSVSGSVTAGDGATLNENDTVKVGDVTLPNENVTATFGTAITFKIPANVAAGLQAGANYTFTVKVNGTALTSGYSVSADGTEITVDGAYITGNVEIAVVKNYLAPNVFTVTVNGDGASDVTVSADQVALNAPLTITLNKVAGYDYTVTVKMGDETLTLTPVDDVYSIEGVTANVTVTVTKTAAYELSASVYFNVNNTTAWLVVNKVAKLESGNYTFNGIQMMWTDSYGGAYVTVVFADTNPALEGTVAIDASTTAAVVENKLDANKTGKIDANDAQFVYNVYNGDYTEITAEVTVEKLLRADVNGDKTVDSVDAQAIISEVVK